jgi:hypothetical protein
MEAAITLQNILDAIQAIATRLDSLNQDKPLIYCSELTNEIAAALAKAHTEMAIAGLNSDNPFFKSKYADLAEIVRVSRPVLSKNGITIPQVLIDCDDGSWLISRMMHTSGQWMESKVRIKPPKNDIQSYASIVSYQKRYAYAALAGVVSGDEDDDAETVVASTREAFAKGTALNKNLNNKKNDYETITREQYEELELELTDHDDVAEKILDNMQIRNLMDLPKDKFRYTIDRVRSIKNTRKGNK